VSNELGHGAFPHQHGSPLSLRARIDAQLVDRIQEAVELAGLGVLVDVRKAAGRPAPDESSERDRREFVVMGERLLEHLSAAFEASITDEQRVRFREAQETAPDARARLLSGQVFLAKRLPDYWQRFESYRTDFAQAALHAGTRPGWLARLLGS
jgi:hypothetical protein